MRIQLYQFYPMMLLQHNLPKLRNLRHQGSTKKHKGKAGIEFLNLTEFGLFGAKGRSSKLFNGNAYSVPLQTVNGKTWGELKKKLGQKGANKAFRDAGLKVTKTDKEYAKQTLISKETKVRKGCHSYLNF